MIYDLSYNEDHHPCSTGHEIYGVHDKEKEGEKNKYYTVTSHLGKMIRNINPSDA